MPAQPDPAISRIRHPSITPLELSDVQVDGATLWQWMGSPLFAAALCRAMERWLDGASTGEDEPLPEGLTKFDAVYLAGGRAQDDAWQAGFSRIPCPVLFSDEPVFAGERGGFDFLQKLGLRGWVLDLGKSHLKISTPDWRGVFPRDRTRLRLSGEVPLHEVPAQRRRLREFIACKLQSALVESNCRPQALLMALPVKLDEDGAPHSSNYAGMRGDRTFLRDAVEMAGMPGLPLFVINDAELAALSALSDERTAGFRRMLVLTMGFGFGAAMIQRRSRT